MTTAVSNSVTLPVIDSSNGTLTDEYINGLVEGGSWQFGGGPRILSYSFNINYDLDGFGNVIPGPGGAWTSLLVDAVNRALGAWSTVANINFQNIASGTYFYDSGADIALTLTGNDLQSAFGAVGLGVFPDPAFANDLRDALGFTASEYPNPTGDVFLDNFYSGYQYLYEGGFGYGAILHEIGHALGLKHPVDDGGNGRPTFAQLGIATYDSERWTVMSSNDVAGSTLFAGNVASPMSLDILAIQQIYGANMAYHTGNDTYAFAFNSGNPLSTIWDAGGIDVIDASVTAWSGVTIDLSPGIGFVKDSQSNSALMAIAYGVDIENAVGSNGADTIFGNALNNDLDGRGGADMMAGRGGNDTYYVNDPGDSVIENQGEGVDTVISSRSDMLLPANVENLILSFLGAHGTGNAQGNVLTSMAADQMLIGGAGDDTYVISGNSAPTYFAFSGDPGDYVSGGQNYYFYSGMGSFSISVADSSGDTLVDTLTVNFSGPAFWSLDFSTRFTGQPLQPGTFTGAVRYPFDFSGHPGLDIFGDGRGSNTLTGAFTVNAASFDYSGASPTVLDFSVSFELHSEGAIPALHGVLNINHPGSAGSVVELPNEGMDTVQSAVSFVLPANVEALILTGNGNINGTGNDLNNTLTGNSGNNVLDGGTGADTANYGDAASGVVVNLSSGTATGGAGSDTLVNIENVTGSNANDTLIGDPHNNVLDGGLGADLMVGGFGNDTYYVDGQFDLVIEDFNFGTDTVISSTSFYLYDNIENLTLAAGTGNTFGSANASNNTLIGNEGGNLLIGWDGNDTLSGGAGDDVIYGVNNDDVLNGDAGIDVLIAGDGNDTLDGGADADALYGENGNDVLYGGTGFVTDILVAGAGNDTLDGSASIASGQPRNAGDFDFLYGGTGDDTYYVDTPSDLTFEFNGNAEGIDTVIADINGAGFYLYDSVENLTLVGNTVYGVGNGQDNVITGNAIGTYLLGGGGNDTMNGKDGNDVLFGEAGADTFVFERGTGGDVIGDFEVGIDKIKLVGIGYNSFADVSPHMIAGATGAIDLGLGDFIVINGVNTSSLMAADFLFA